VVVLLVHLYPNEDDHDRGLSSDNTAFPIEETCLSSINDRNHTNFLLEIFIIFLIKNRVNH
jgi:hypothetical protein